MILHAYVFVLLVMVVTIQQHDLGHRVESVAMQEDEWRHNVFIAHDYQNPHDED